MNELCFDFHVVSHVSVWEMHSHGNGHNMDRHRVRRTKTHRTLVARLSLQSSYSNETRLDRKK